MQGVNKRFGGLQALSDVGLQIKQGEIYGLIGPNGAGKTTFFNVHHRPVHARLGRVQARRPEPTRRRPCYQVAKAGIARTFQNIRLFGGMTALENVMVGRHVRTKARPDRRGVPDARPSARKSARSRSARSNCWTTWASRSTRTTRRATCSYGHQRRLEIARALATDPKLLALDEPAAGMNATEKVELTRLLDKIRADGKTILLIEHDVKLVMGLCNQHDGARLRQGDCARSAARRAEGSEGDRSLSGCRSPLMSTTQTQC